MTDKPEQVELTRQSEQTNQVSIGRYAIRRQIKRGGMAIVFLAYDPQTQRHVALKLLPGQTDPDADREYRRRFQREVKAIAALDHPRIVPVYDFGETDAYLFIVMRYMEGGTLVDRLQNGPLALEEAVRILEQVGAALDEVHRNSIVHRDLKPGNILFDEQGNAFLADFGLVKALESQSVSSLTSDGVVVGTPAYMSPEQVDGRAHIDGRSDLYGLGVVLFEMLTGTPPYSAASGMSLAIKHILEPIPDVLQSRPDLPPAVKQIIDRMMAKDPEDRYQTAAEIIDDLHRVLAGKPLLWVPRAEEGTLVLGQAVGTRSRRQLPVLFLLLSILVIGLTVGGAYVTRLFNTSAERLPTSEPVENILVQTVVVVFTATPNPLTPSATASSTPTATFAAVRPAATAQPPSSTPDPGTGGATSGGTDSGGGDGSTTGGGTTGSTDGGADSGDDGGLLDSLIGGLIGGGD